MVTDKEAQSLTVIPPARVNFYAPASTRLSGACVHRTGR
jgi:hypothetical protein